MYITSISLENVRAFEKFELNLLENGPSGFAVPRMRTLLIGENGTGKTTLLRAIAVGIADEEDASGLLSESIGSLVTEGESDARIEIDLCNESGLIPSKYVTNIERNNGSDRLVSKELLNLNKETLSTSPQVFACAYGVSRSFQGRPTGRNYRVVDSVYNLFDYETPMIPTELAYFRLKRFIRKQNYSWNGFWNRTKRALGLPEDVALHLGDLGGLFVSGKGIGNNIPIEAWADGYRLTLAWLFDIYAWAMFADRLDRTTFEINGIVLMDEVEQHLHPSLQLSQVNRLSKFLGKVQVIATTHSPFVAIGVEPPELISLRRDLAGVYAETTLPNFYSYSVEEMSSHERLFNANVYNAELSIKLSRHQELIKIPESNLSKEQETELEQLGKELKELELIKLQESEDGVLSELLAILKAQGL